MHDLTDAQRDYLELRDRSASVQLATLDADNRPEASYAPCVWYQGHFFLFLSELSSHTANLRRTPDVSLLLLDDVREVSNYFARKRASLHGYARIIAREDELYAAVMTEFRQRFGKVMQIIEPLPDFHLFRIDLRDGSFVRGFGQAYRVKGKAMDALEPVDPRK